MFRDDDDDDGMFQAGVHVVLTAVAAVLDSSAPDPRKLTLDERRSTNLLDDAADAADCERSGTGIRVSIRRMSCTLRCGS